MWGRSVAGISDTAHLLRVPSKHGLKIIVDEKEGAPMWITAISPCYFMCMSAYACYVCHANVKCKVTVWPNWRCICISKECVCVCVCACVCLPVWRHSICKVYSTDTIYTALDTCSSLTKYLLSARWKTAPSFRQGTEFRFCSGGLFKEVPEVFWARGGPQGVVLVSYLGAQLHRATHSTINRPCQVNWGMRHETTGSCQAGRNRAPRASSPPIQ